MFATLEKDNSLFIFTNIQHPREYDISEYNTEANTFAIAEIYFWW